MGPYRHYSTESLTSQLEPSLSSNCCTQSLTRIRAGEAVGVAGLQQEEGQQRWRRAARAPAASCALTELLGLVRGGLGRPIYEQQRPGRELQACWRPWRVPVVAAAQGRSWKQRAELCDGGGRGGCDGSAWLELRRGGAPGCGGGRASAHAASRGEKETEDEEGE